MVNIWPKTGFEKLSQHLARTVFSTLNLSYSSDACSWCSEVPKLKLVKRRLCFTQRVSIIYLVTRYKRRGKNLDPREKLESYLIAELFEILFMLHWPVQELSTVKSPCLGHI